jgi:hypothetical protein
MAPRSKSAKTKPRSNAKTKARPKARAKSLKEYARKRDFARTPEPKPQVVAATTNEFVVQKHAARRLHYDLRLELDGVLKSWAVTRGPSLTLGEKRLAVRTRGSPRVTSSSPSMVRGSRAAGISSACARDAGRSPSRGS